MEIISFNTKFGQTTVKQYAPDLLMQGHNNVELYIKSYGMGIH